MGTSSANTQSSGVTTLCRILHGSTTVYFWKAATNHPGTPCIASKISRNSWSLFNNTTIFSAHLPSQTKFHHWYDLFACRDILIFFASHCTPTPCGAPCHHHIWTKMKQHLPTYPYTSAMAPTHSHFLISPNKPSAPAPTQQIPTAPAKPPYGNTLHTDWSQCAVVELPLFEPTITYYPPWPPLPHRMYWYPPK